MSEKATVNGTNVFCLYLPVILFCCLLHLQSQSLRQRSRSMLMLKSSFRMGPQGPSAAPLNQKIWSAVRPRWPGTSSRANPTVRSPNRRMWWVLARVVWVHGFPSDPGCFPEIVLSTRTHEDQRKCSVWNSPVTKYTEVQGFVFVCFKAPCSFCLLSRIVSASYFYLVTF